MGEMHSLKNCCQSFYGQSWALAAGAHGPPGFSYVILIGSTYLCEGQLGVGVKVAARLVAGRFYAPARLGARASFLIYL